MRSLTFRGLTLAFLAVLLLLPMGQVDAAKNLIYDEAGLLSSEEIASLNTLANELGAERETDIIIITTNNPDNIDIEIMVGDFYDDQAPGYDQPHGNAVILGLDMKERDVFLAGFAKAEVYLHNERLDQIRNRITPNLSNGNYYAAFESFIQTSHRYMGYEPHVNPENILFKLWFQLAVSIGLGALVVTTMAYRSGGRVTVNARTYEDGAASGVLNRQDQYIRTTVTKRKIPKNNGGGGSGRGGGGGGFTGGGRSYSGSRGKF